MSVGRSVGTSKLIGWLMTANSPRIELAGEEHSVSSTPCSGTGNGLKRFLITVEGDGAETVRVNILDPSGQQVASGQTSIRSSLAEVEVPVGSGAGATWSLQLTRAGEGTLEDYSVTLDSKLPPCSTPSNCRIPAFIIPSVHGFVADADGS